MWWNWWNDWKMRLNKQCFTKKHMKKLNPIEIKNAKKLSKKRANYAKHSSPHKTKMIEKLIWNPVMSNRKQFKKIKIMKFRKTINGSANDKKKIWCLMKWTKNKNRMSKKITKMSTLIKKKKKLEIEKTIDLKNKMKFLYDEFFSAFLSVNFSDISQAIWLTKLKCPKLIIKQKMERTVRWFQADKASESDGIINKFLKVCVRLGYTEGVRRTVDCQIDRCPSPQKTGQLYIPKVGRWPHDGCLRLDLQRGSDFAWSDQKNSDFAYLITWWCITIDDYYLITKAFQRLFI